MKVFLICRRWLDLQSRHSKRRYVSLPVNNVYIELVKPLADDGLGKFLAKHGSGTLHHICYIVDNMEEAVEYFIDEKGLEIIGGIRHIPCFEKALFFHHGGTGNVLIELVSGAVCPLPIIAGGNDIMNTQV